MPDAKPLRVTVLWSPLPRQVHQKALLLAEGATVWQAAQASGLLEQFPQIDPEVAVMGIWGRKAALGRRLRDGDRVEIYRPLVVDPKVARRARFQKQGAKTAGLFAKKRAGAKAGY